MSEKTFSVNAAPISGSIRVTASLFLEQDDGVEIKTLLLVGIPGVSKRSVFFPKLFQNRCLESEVLKGPLRACRIFRHNREHNILHQYSMKL